MYQESCMTVMQSKKALKHHTFHQVQHFSQFFWHLFKLSCWCCWYIAALGVLDRAPQKDPSQLVKAAADSSPEPWTLPSPLAPASSYDSEGTGPQSASWLTSQPTASQHSPDRMCRGRSRWTESGYSLRGWRCCLGMRCYRTFVGTAQRCDWLGCRRGLFHWSWRNKQWCCLFASRLPWLACCWCYLRQRPIHPPNDAGPLERVVGRVFHRLEELIGSRPPSRAEWWHRQQTSDWRKSSFNVLLRPSKLTCSQVWRWFRRPVQFYGNRKVQSPIFFRWDVWEVTQ